MDIVEWFIKQSKGDKAIIIFIAVAIIYFATGVITAINQLITWKKKKKLECTQVLK